MYVMYRINKNNNLTFSFEKDDAGNLVLNNKELISNNDIHLQLPFLKNDIELSKFASEKGSDYVCIDRNDLGLFIIFDCTGDNITVSEHYNIPNQNSSLFNIGSSSDIEKRRLLGEIMIDFMKVDSLNEYQNNVFPKLKEMHRNSCDWEKFSSDANVFFGFPRGRSKK